MQVYVSTLRHATPPPGMLRRVLTVALAAEAVTVVSWILASPFPLGQDEHFAVYATDVCPSTYFLTFWAQNGGSKWRGRPARGGMAHPNPPAHAKHGHPLGMVHAPA